MRKVVITGPTGAIGHALIEECIKNTDEIFCICRPASERIKTLPKYSKLHILEYDLCDLGKASSDLPNDCDVFYHFGWSGTFGNVRNDMSLQVNNIQYTLDAVDLAFSCGCHTFVGAGSQAEYGRVEGKLRGDTPAFPENGYGMAKLCAGHMSKVQAHKYGIKHIWTRILSVYGPYDGNYTMIMSTINKLLINESPSFTKAEQLWDFLYSKDAGAIMYALGGEESKDGKIYCLGSGVANPLKEYIEIIRDEINPEIKLRFGDITYSEKQVMYLCADNSDVLNDLSYEYQYDFRDGIRETIDWVKRNSAL